MKELSDWLFYEADISRLQLQAARPDFSPLFLFSLLSYNVNQRLYMLLAADYSAYALWCFPRCHSNLFFSTVQHIMGVCESCLSHSSALVTAFQVGRFPSPLHHSLLFYSCSFLCCFLLIFPSLLSFMPDTFHPHGSPSAPASFDSPPPSFHRPNRALYLHRLCPIRRAALWVMGAQIPHRSPHLSRWWNLSAWERQSWSPLSKKALFLLLCLELL